MKNNTYCAFLRGVNVNGRTMKMAEVCDVFRTAGMTDVTSVLASGNIIFRSDCPQADLRDVLESAMKSYYKVNSQAEILGHLKKFKHKITEENCMRGTKYE